MDLSFGHISIAAIIMAFCGGMFGACIGAIQGFALLGIVGVGAMALNASGSSFLMNVAFGYWLFPAIWFTGYCIAASYAGKKGWCEGKCLTASLLALKHPSVMLVAGIAGTIGYLFYYLCNNVLKINADNGAVTVVTLCLLYKLISEGTVFGKTPNSVKTAGGRYSTAHDEHWIPFLHDGPIKLLIGFSLSGIAAAATYAVGVQYGALEDVSIWASRSPAFICFFISAASLIFAACGLTIPATHQTTLAAAYAFCSSAATGCNMAVAFTWAIAVGVLATFLGDFFGDTFTMWGNTWIDPPAVVHLTVSVFVFNLPENVISGIWMPIIILAAMVVLALTVYRPAKKVAFA